MKILLVDDEIDLTDSLKEVLSKENFSVDVANDPYDGLEFLKISKYDLIILDIMMPKLNGYEFLKKIREEKNDTSVIFLSAKSELNDKLQGLELGADDYLPKPFSSKELVARIRAIIRRNNKNSNNIVEFHGLKLNLSNYTLEYGDKKVLLANKEFQILELFMLNPNKVYSTNDILNNVWSYESYSDITTVWTFLSNLRKKIASICPNVQIKLNRGLGYSLEYVQKAEN